jgi:iron complex outermembrane receptor protein
VQVYSFGTFSHRHNDAFLTYRVPDAANNIPEVFPNGYSPHLHVYDHDGQFTLGVKSTGKTGFRFDLSTTYGEDRVSYTESTALNASLGPASPTNFYIGRVKSTEWTTNLDVQKDIHWAPAQPLSLAVGGEYRESTYGIEAGEPASYIDGGYRSTSGAQAGCAPADRRGDRLLAKLGRPVAPSCVERLYQRRADARPGHRGRAGGPS